jgi:hypothetical protein
VRNDLAGQWKPDDIRFDELRELATAAGVSGL